MFSLLPAARCSRRLDGVDPETGGDVPQRLHRLLVRLVVVLHLGDAAKMSTHAHTKRLWMKVRVNSPWSAVQRRRATSAQRLLVGVKRDAFCWTRKTQGQRKGACLQAEPMNMVNPWLEGAHGYSTLSRMSTGGYSYTPGYKPIRGP